MRLKALASNPTVKANDPNLPFVALEHLEPGTGRLLPGLNLEAKNADDSVAHEAGDVRFGKLRPYLAKSFLAEESGAGSGELLVLRPGPHLLSKYLWYITLSRPFIDWAVATSYGVKMPRTSWDSLGAFEINPPAVEEQRRIVDVLDTETARIDEMIREQVRLLDLLEERYRAELLALVTCGVDSANGATPRAELSGVPVSVDWLVCPLRSLPVEIQTGPFGSQLHQSDYVDDGFPVVNPANLVGGRIKAIDGMAVSAAKRLELARHVLRPGDIVFGRRGEMGRAGLVGDEESGWLCGTGSLLIRFLDPVFDSRYLKRYLETSLVKQYLEAASVGATMDNLNSGIVGRIPLVVPPDDEQRRIADAADRLEQNTMALSLEISGCMALLHEHREALITAAVTGELDAVRKVA